MKKLFIYFSLSLCLLMLMDCGAVDPQKNYQVSITASPAEGGTVSPSSGQFEAGEVVEISASPSEGWRFDHWEGDYSGTSSMAEITVDSDKDIKAIFIKREYTLSIDTEGKGTIDERVIQTKSTDYEYGTVVELTAIPTKGWEFIEWQGDLISSENPKQITVNEPKVVIAVFEQKTKIIYVNVNAAGGNSGNSWNDAYTSLQDALEQARQDAEIWVAEGTYFPNIKDGEQTGDREATFQLKSEVGIYGGFEGTESNREQRDWNENKTILSGEINISNFKDDNSCHVVTGSGVSSSAILDGFIITQGNAGGACPDNDIGGGGGMYNFHGSPTIRNTTFINNFSDAVKNRASIHEGYDMKPQFDNCQFINNTGYGMYNSLRDSKISISNSHFKGNSEEDIYIRLSSVTITDTYFVYNNTNDFTGRAISNSEGIVKIERSLFSGLQSSIGAGIFNEEGQVTIINSVFSDNTATSTFSGLRNYGDGGSIYNLYGSLKIIGSLFIDNSADSDGGAIAGYYSGSAIDVINSTFFNNRAGTYGGAIYGSGNIFNSIVWDNNATSSNYNEIYGSFFVRNSLILGGLTDNLEDGGGNISESPNFVDVGNRNLRIESNSPTIDAGTNEPLDLDGDGDTVDDVPEDLDGNPRIQNGTVDIGAYEADSN